MFTLSIVPKHIRDFKPHTFLYRVKSFFKKLWEEIKSIPSSFVSYFSTGNVIRMIPLILMMLFFSFDGMAQTAAGGFASATTTIQGYQVQVSNLMKAIGAVIAIVGAFNVFFKMQNGDQDVKNILVLQNWLERIRKEVINKALSIKRISEFLNFPILAQPTLKKI